MDTKSKLTQDLKDAMRARDELRKRTIRLTMAAIKNAEIDKRSELEESAVIAILQKEVKSCRETIEGAQRANRPDLIAEAEAEISILEAYLPQPLTSDELEILAREAVAEAGATSPREMGNVMKILMPRVQGRADGKEASQIVSRLLNR
ncbi:MAG: GatB/YqeY domain-containing protein [Chloroflexi bacterium]|nr:GatB/YqeY domain-containing protein [Chloroflexota bacterium]